MILNLQNSRFLDSLANSFLNTSVSLEPHQAGTGPQERSFYPLVHTEREKGESAIRKKEGGADGRGDICKEKLQVNKSVKSPCLN